MLLRLKIDPNPERRRNDSAQSDKDLKRLTENQIGLARRNRFIGVLSTFGLADPSCTWCVLMVDVPLLGIGFYQKLSNAAFWRQPDISIDLDSSLGLHHRRFRHIACLSMTKKKSECLLDVPH